MGKDEVKGEIPGKRDFTIDDILSTISGPEAGKAAEILTGYVTQTHAELASLRRDVQMYERQNESLKARLAAERKRAETAEEKAIRDDLTGAFDRGYFEQRLRDELDRKERFEQPVTLIMMDIDNFTTFNNTYGHPVGDYVLKEITGLVWDETRGVDAFCRYGGEEFAVIAPQCDSEGAKVIAEKIRERVENHAFTYEGPDDSEPISFNVSLSLGYATVNAGETVKAEALTKRADDALYNSKRSGRNATSVWTDGDTKVIGKGNS